MHRFSLISFAVLFAGYVWLWSWALRTESLLTVTFLDVGQGDSIVIQTPTGHTLIVDTGGRKSNENMGRKVVAPFLRSRGINRLDAILLTHPDEDHIGGTEEVLNRIPTARLMKTEYDGQSATYRDTIATAITKHVMITKLHAGEMIDFGDGVTAEVLNPSTVLGVKDNDTSIVLRVKYGNCSFLLTGDAEIASEWSMLSRHVDLRSDVLKLGHHGSRTSSSEEFLASVQPQIAVVSAGRRNIYGHPHPSVMERLAKRKIGVVRTDKQGAIMMQCDGKTIRINTMLTR